MAEVQTLGLIWNERIPAAIAVGTKNPIGLRVSAYATKIITANRSFNNVAKFGHFGLLSGKRIMTAPEINAIDAIKYGKVFGPTGSAKKGDSN